MGVCCGFASPTAPAQRTVPALLDGPRPRPTQSTVSREDRFGETCCPQGPLAKCRRSREGPCEPHQRHAQQGSKPSQVTPAPSQTRGKMTDPQGSARPTSHRTGRVGPGRPPPAPWWLPSGIDMAPGRGHGSETPQPVWMSWTPPAPLSLSPPGSLPLHRGCRLPTPAVAGSPLTSNTHD